jgi:hypothetical protein
MKEYAKTIVAVVMAALVALQTALTDGGVSSQEWITIALAALGALGVLAVPNAITAKQRREHVRRP